METQTQHIPQLSTLEERIAEQDKRRAPQAGTVEPQKEHDRLIKEDRERFENQGQKDASANPATAGKPGDESVDYESLTIPELKDLAHKRGITISSDMRKDEIIDALEQG